MKEITKEKIEKYYLPTILARVKDYLQVLSQK